MTESEKDKLYSARFKQCRNIIWSLVDKSYKRLPASSLLEKEDLVQLACCTLYSKMLSYDEKRGAFGTYIYSCISHKLSDELRKEWRKYRNERLVVDIDEIDESRIISKW